MKFKVKLFDAERQELEIENKVIGGILFESKEAFDFFINAIRSSLPLNFQYKVITKKETHKNNSVRNRKDSSIFQK